MSNQASRHWQKQKGTGSTRQKFESGKKEGQPCNRQKSEKKVEADKNGRNDRQNNPNVEDLKARKGKQGKVHEVPVAKKKCSENTAKPHLVNKNKNEGGKNTKEKKDGLQSIDQKKQQSDTLQEKEKDYENSRDIDSEMCGPGKKETKQEVRCKTENSESDASVSKNKRKEVDCDVQPCNREKSEKKVEVDKKGRNDRGKNPSIEDLKERNGKGKVHEVPVAKKKCEDSAKPHLIYENKNEGDKNTEEKKDVLLNIDQKKQSDILQEKEQEYENSRVIDSKMCGPSKKEMKQEVRSKTEKSASDAPVTKNERKEVESTKNDSQEEMKSDTIKRKNTTAEDCEILLPTKRQRLCDHQIPYTPSDFASFLKIVPLYHFQVPPVVFTKNRRLEQTRT